MSDFFYLVSLEFGGLCVGGGGAGEVSLRELCGFFFFPRFFLLPFDACFRDTQSAFLKWFFLPCSARTGVCLLFFFCGKNTGGLVWLRVWDAI